MNIRIVCFTTPDEGNREDGNVYYAEFALVLHPTKNFSEPIWQEPVAGSVVSHKTKDAFVKEAQALGYTVEWPDSIVKEVLFDEEDDED